MFASVKWCAEPIAQPSGLTRSQFKVMGLSLEFCVCSVSPLPLEGFSLNVGLNFGQMFTSVGHCAEPITQPYGLKVKVTVDGHEFEPWIWCQLHISFILGRIFFKRWSYVCLSEMMCWIHNSAMLTQGQITIECRSPFWALNFDATPLPFRLPVEPIAQRCRVKVKVIIEGHPSLSCSLHIFWTLWKIFMKLWTNVCLSEAMCRTHNSSMATQGQGHN